MSEVGGHPGDRGYYDPPGRPSQPGVRHLKRTLTRENAHTCRKVIVYNGEECFERDTEWGVVHLSKCSMFVVRRVPRRQVSPFHYSYAPLKYVVAVSTFMYDYICSPQIMK